MMNRFDTIIIGAGQAGPSLAGKLTGAGPAGSRCGRSCAQ
jgi:cation diffusion facilitator CzcD-associated flavoprotein CzcO